MASTTIDPIATALKNAAAGIAGLSGSVTVKGFRWAPKGDLDALPAAVVYLPAIERTEIDKREDHLGSNDWRLNYPVHFHFSADDAEFAQAQAAEVIEAWIKAIDADQGLSGECQEAKVIRVEEPDIAELNNRKVIRVVTRVDVLEFVP